MDSTSIPRCSTAHPALRSSGACTGRVFRPPDARSTTVTRNFMAPPHSPRRLRQHGKRQLRSATPPPCSYYRLDAAPAADRRLSRHPATVPMGLELVPAVLRERVAIQRPHQVLKPLAQL